MLAAMIIIIEDLFMLKQKIWYSSRYTSSKQIIYVYLQTINCVFQNFYYPSDTFYYHNTQTEWERKAKYLNLSIPTSSYV